MVLFVILYKVVLTFKSVDEIPVCDHSNESYCRIFTCCYSFSTILEAKFEIFSSFKEEERVKRERTLQVEIQRYPVKYARPTSPGLSRSSR